MDLTILHNADWTMIRRRCFLKKYFSLIFTTLVIGEMKTSKITMYGKLR